VAVGKTETPEGALENGIVTAPAAVGKAVRGLCDACGVTAAQAVTCVAGSMVIVRKIDLPAVSPAQLSQIIRLEAQKYIPYDVADSLIEHQLLGPAPGDAGRVEVMLVAAHRDLVEGRVQALEEARLEPLVVDVEPYASVYALVENPPETAGPGRTLALIELGASHTEVTLVAGGQFALTRTIPIGGDNLTRALAGVLRQDWEEAEQFKQEECSALVSRDLSFDAPQDYQVQAALGNVFDHLVLEINRTIHSYQAQLPEEAEEALIERILISGGGARMRDLDTLLEQRLNAPVQRANALAAQDLAGAETLPAAILAEAPFYSVCLGLARREEVLERAR
jgi:type IV pilus assembly protein PilM